MKIRMAHLRDQGIDFAVFDTDVASRRDADRNTLLAQLVATARANGLKVDKGALAYREGNRIEFYGTPDLVKYLAAQGGIARWTHEIEH